MLCQTSPGVIVVFIVVSIGAAENEISEIPDGIRFGSLETAFSADGIFYKHVIYVFEEDILHPGTFLFDHNGHALMRFSPVSGDIEIVCGSTEERNADGPGEGGALGRRFSSISDITQFNGSIYLTDGGASCVKTFDYGQKLIRNYVGKCNDFLKNNPSNALELVRSTSVPADSNILHDVTAFEPVDNGAYFIITFSFSEKLYRFNPIEYTLENLLPEDKLLALSNDYTGFLLKPDNTGFYTFRSYGLSFYNLSSEMATQLTGQQGKPWKIMGGYLGQGILHRLLYLRWLEPDQLIITNTDEIEDALVIIDLQTDKFYYLCLGIYDHTKTGPMESCQVNAVTSLTFVNDTLYITAATQGALLNEEGLERTTASVYKLHVQVLWCDLMEKPASLIVSPEKSRYRYGSSIQLTCPTGYGLNASYDRLYCNSTAADNKITWNEVFPNCSPDLKIISISPTSGRKSGGNPITAAGVIPVDGNISVTLVDVDKSHTLEFSISSNQVRFLMLPMTTAGKVQLEFNLAGQINRFYYSYLPDPVLLTDSVTTIPSGGVYGRLKIQNIDSAQKYRLSYLSAARDDSSCVKKTEISEVWCTLQGHHPNRKTDESPAAETLRVYLYADEVRVEKIIAMKVLAFDPAIEINHENDLENNGSNYTLQLTGSHLDLHELNDQYQIGLTAVMSGEKTPGLKCNIAQDRISNQSLTCTLDSRLVESNVKYRIQVHMGSLILEAGLAGMESPHKPKLQRNPSNKTFIILLAVAAVLLAVVPIIFLTRRSKRKDYHPVNHSLSADTEKHVFFNIKSELKAQLEHVTIDQSRLKKYPEHMIGNGKFGVVHKGFLYNGTGKTAAAINTLREAEWKKESVEEVLERAAFLFEFKHPNVLPVLGVCWASGSIPEVITPCMESTDLHSLVSNSSLNFTDGDLVHFSMQVACGMDYLSSYEFVHKDLIARNCLVSEQYVVRIADFSLSVSDHSTIYYKLSSRKPPVPVKWMSPESLQSEKFTSNSDVWSIGVLMWELFSHGSEPYEEINFLDIKSYLLGGNRLTCPNATPDLIYGKMMECWSEAPGRRPSFSSLRVFLSNVLQHHIDEYPRHYTTVVPATSSPLRENKETDDMELQIML